MKRMLRQGGISLVAAIFLIVVLAGLVAALSSLVSNQQQAAGLDVQGARAYQAARAGIEWGLYQVQRNGNACNSSTNVSFPATSTLNPFVVTVVCSTTTNGNYTEHKITATACNIPSAGACPNTTNNIDYVQRVMRIQF